MKLYMANIKYCMQKILGFSSMFVYFCVKALR